jgi:nucleotide-binding universal stress UspA family protein
MAVLWWRAAPWARVRQIYHPPACFECAHRARPPVLIGNIAARRAIPPTRRRLRFRVQRMATPSVVLAMLSAVCQLASTMRRRGASDTTVSQHDDHDQDAGSRRRVGRRNRGVARMAGAGRPERVGSQDSLILGQEPLLPVSRAIIAGYDGTALGRKAVVEAGLRAWPTGCVFVVHAYRSPPGYLGSPYTERRMSAARAAGRRLLEDLFGDRGLPDVEYIPELLSGRPMEAIARVAAAREADAIVIGADRRVVVTARRWNDERVEAESLRVRAHGAYSDVPPTTSPKTYESKDRTTPGKCPGGVGGRVATCYSPSEPKCSMMRSAYHSGQGTSGLVFV